MSKRATPRDKGVLPWSKYSGDFKLACAATIQAYRQEQTPEFPGVDIDAIHLVHRKPKHK